MKSSHNKYSPRNASVAPPATDSSAPRGMGVAAKRSWAISNSSAHLEAIRHYERGITSLPEGPARDRREIELELARGLSLFTAEGFASIKAAEAYTRARKLAEHRGDSRQRFMAVYGLWQSANGAGMIRECRRLSDGLLQLTAGKADEGLHLQARHSAWATAMFAGEPAAAREHSDAGRRLYDPERHRFHHQHYGGHDPGVCASSIGALVYWLLGYPEKGLTIGNEALALANASLTRSVLH